MSPPRSAPPAIGNSCALLRPETDSSTPKQSGDDIGKGPTFYYNTFKAGRILVSNVN